MEQAMYQGSKQQRIIFSVLMAIAILILLSQTTAAISSASKKLAASRQIVLGQQVIGAPIRSTVAQSRITRHIHEESKKIYDLSYPLSNKTLHWPTNSGFNYTVDRDAQVNNSATNSSYHVKSDTFCTAVHTGTHLDAPIHFNAGGWTVEQIPLERLIDVPVTVIDLSGKVSKDKSYAFLKEDFVDKKSSKPLVNPNSVVLVYTGISNSYNQGAKAYFGTDSKNMSEMSIPGFSREAASFLVEQKVYGVGLDAPSADSSQRHGTNDSFDPQAHTIFNGNNIYILENINGKLSQLVNSTSARLTIAPLPIENGSGSPVRLIAITGHYESASQATNSAHTGTSHLNLTMLISMILCIVPFMI